MSNTNAIRIKSEESRRKYQTPKIADDSPLRSMPWHMLPDKIADEISESLETAHWIVAVPNATSAIVTSEMIAENPPGFVVVLVFDEQSFEEPRDHKPGDVYIVT